MVSSAGIGTDGSEMNWAQTALTQTLYMISVHPLWVLENFIVKDFWARGSGDEVPANLGYEMAGEMLRPEMRWSELEQAASLLADDIKGEDSEESGASFYSVILRVDRQGRPLTLSVEPYLRGAYPWTWEFRRTSEEVQTPDDALDWAPGATE